jgi:hypothetical protein
MMQAFLPCEPKFKFLGFKSIFYHFTMTVDIHAVIFYRDGLLVFLTTPLGGSLTPRGDFLVL